MSYEIRRVPLDWEHPLLPRHLDLGHPHRAPNFDGSLGCFQPKWNRTFADAVQAWDEGRVFWLANVHDDQKPGSENYDPLLKPTLADYAREYPTPNPLLYYPDWDDAERDGFQVCALLPQGIPVSPVLASEPDAQKWMTDRGLLDLPGTPAAVRGLPLAALIKGDTPLERAGRQSKPDPLIRKTTSKLRSQRPLAGNRPVPTVEGTVPLDPPYDVGWVVYFNGVPMNVDMDLTDNELIEALERGARSKEGGK